MADALERHLLLAKNANGKALESLIVKILNDPVVFTLTAFLTLPNIQQQAQDNELAPWIKLLRIFSYGEYSDYATNQSSLPALDPPALRKLKKLTLISMASGTHHLTYSDMQQRLGMDNVRDLEDLLIEATYESLVRAKLNTRTQSVYIESTAGRDLDPEDDLDTVLASLEAWSRNCDAVLLQIQAATRETQKSAMDRKRDVAAHHQALHKAKEQVLLNRHAGRQRHSNGTGPLSGVAAGADDDDQLLDDVMTDAVTKPTASQTPSRSTQAVEASSQRRMNTSNRKRKTPGPRRSG